MRGFKHMDAYLDELDWRFNNRDNPWLFRGTLLRLLQAEHVEYKDLVVRIESSLVGGLPCVRPMFTLVNLHLLF